MPLFQHDVKLKILLRHKPKEWKTEVIIYEQTEYKKKI